MTGCFVYFREKEKLVLGGFHAEQNEVSDNTVKEDEIKKAVLDHRMKLKEGAIKKPNKKSRLRVQVTLQNALARVTQLL